MECPNCKKTYDDEFNFCPWCGSEKPLIYDEDVKSFEYEDELLEEESSSFEMEFKNIEEELKELKEDAIRFEENKKNMTNYATPFGDIWIGIDASKIQMEEAEGQICVVLLGCWQPLPRPC